MQDDSPEQMIRQYIAAGAAEGAMAAAMKLSKALEVGLDEVLAAVREIGQPAAALAGTATAVSSATGSVTVIRGAEVNEVTRQASQGGLARLTPIRGFSRLSCS